MTELRRRMLEELRLRNYSPNTIEVYLRCVANFAHHFRVFPDRLGPGHVREYQLFLVERKKVSWAVFNQTVCALRFFYHHTLHIGNRESMFPDRRTIRESVGEFPADHSVRFALSMLSVR
jgi:hypothetical protein